MLYIYLSLVLLSQLTQNLYASQHQELLSLVTKKRAALQFKDTFAHQMRAIKLQDEQLRQTILQLSKMKGQIKTMRRQMVAERWMKLGYKARMRENEEYAIKWQFEIARLKEVVKNKDCQLKEVEQKSAKDKEEYKKAYKEMEDKFKAECHSKTFWIQTMINFHFKRREKDKQMKTVKKELEDRVKVSSNLSHSEWVSRGKELHTFLQSLSQKIEIA